MASNDSVEEVNVGDDMKAEEQTETQKTEDVEVVSVAASEPAPSKIYCKYTPKPTDFLPPKRVYNRRSYVNDLVTSQERITDRLGNLSRELRYAEQELQSVQYNLTKAGLLRKYYPAY